MDIASFGMDIRMALTWLSKYINKLPDDTRKREHESYCRSRAVLGRGVGEGVGTSCRESNDARRRSLAGRRGAPGVGIDPLN